jgi:hypothetical protein
MGGALAQSRVSRRHPPAPQGVDRDTPPVPGPAHSRAPQPASSRSPRRAWSSTLELVPSGPCPFTVNVAAAARSRPRCKRRRRTRGRSSPVSLRQFGACELPRFLGEPPIAERGPRSPWQRGPDSGVHVPCRAANRSPPCCPREPRARRSALIFDSARQPRLRSDGAEFRTRGARGEPRRCRAASALPGHPGGAERALRRAFGPPSTVRNERKHRLPLGRSEVDVCVPVRSERWRSWRS